MFWQLIGRCSASVYTYLISVVVSLSLLISGLLMLPVSAGELKDTVAFAGVTFQGSTSAIGKRYPYSSKLVKENDLAIALYKKLLVVKPDNMTISGHRLNKDSGHRYAVALMIDREFVEISEYSENTLVTDYGDKQFSQVGKGMCKINIQLSGQTVVFDVKNSQIVVSLPMNPKILRELKGCRNNEDFIRQNISETVVCI